MFETHYDEILQLLLHYLASGKEKKSSSAQADQEEYIDYYFFTGLQSLYSLCDSL